MTILLPLNIVAQDNFKDAQEKKERAINLMDNGKIEESIRLLNEAKNLDPSNYVYDYEIGFAYYLKGDYKSSISTFKKVIEYDNSDAQCYQMLGNIYDIDGNPKKALKTYDKGLKLFPKSGRLYLEKGNLYLNQKQYNEALNFYEQGIFNDPMFASNYYRASKLFCNSQEEVWGMIYGEIFINLENDTKRTHEISKLLYDTYKSQIKFTSDTSVSVSFSQQNIIYINPKDLKKSANYLLEALKLPFGSGVYDPTLSESCVGQTAINLRSLNEIREKFVSTYFSKSLNEKHPVVLFEYNKRLINLGLFEAYNYWLLKSGNEEEFNQWLSSHQKNYNDLISWIKENPIYIDSNNKFCRVEYN